MSNTKIKIIVEHDGEVYEQTAYPEDMESFIGQVGNVFIKFQRSDAGIPGGNDAAVVGEADDQANGS